MDDAPAFPPDVRPVARGRAKVFTHGGSQAVRLPKAYRFDGSEVSIRREGDAVILEPVTVKAGSLWERLDRIRGSEQLAYARDPVLETEAVLD